MRALVLSDREVRVDEVPDPQPQAGEALVKVLMAGVCNTDLELVRGYMGFNGVLGHEFVGIVEQALPEENLHLAPASARDDVAVFTEPTAAAFRIVEQVKLTDNDRVVVLGDGKLGQLCAQVIHLHTKNLVCVGKHPWKLQLLSNLGIKTALADEPVMRGADVVVEATGSHLGFERALELVRPEGTIVLKTTVTHPTALDLSIPVINEVTILGSRCGPFRPALEALSLGNVGVRPLVTDTFTLNDADQALQRAAEPDAMKVLIQM